MAENVVRSLILYNIQFFHNLPAIWEWDMTEKQKMCWEHLYNI